MLTNPGTGEITLESGAVLSARATRSEFLSSLEGSSSTTLVKNEPWCSFKFCVVEESLAVAVFFNGEAIQSVHFAVADSVASVWS